jgi:hypothetical protein
VIVGDTVRVLAPFDETYPKTYLITDQVDNRTFVLCEIGAFDVDYLEAL